MTDQQTMPATCGGGWHIQMNIVHMNVCSNLQYCTSNSVPGSHAKVGIRKLFTEFAINSLDSGSLNNGIQRYRGSMARQPRLTLYRCPQKISWGRRILDSVEWSTLKLSGVCYLLLLVRCLAPLSCLIEPHLCYTRFMFYRNGTYWWRVRILIVRMFHRFCPASYDPSTSGSERT